MKTLVESKAERRRQSGNSGQHGFRSMAETESRLVSRVGNWIWRAVATPSNCGIWKYGVVFDPHRCAPPELRAPLK
jgi:hypothetical protein